MEIFITVSFGIIWYQIIAHVGISAGLHRYWTHNSFCAGLIFEYVSLYMAVLAGSLSPLGWAATHRMHHATADTPHDPHSPTHKGFWKVVFSFWTVPNIPRRFAKGLYKNPRMKFFHRHWIKIWIGTALISLIISPYFFVGFVVIPWILSRIGFGLGNALTHDKNGAKDVPWMNLLMAGEGYHAQHHRGKRIRLHRFDSTGWLIEKAINLGIFETKKSK